MIGHFKVIKAINIKGANVVLYKHPNRVSDSGMIRGHYQCITFDDNNKEVDHLSMRHIRHQSDAERFFRYIVSLSVLHYKTADGRIHQLSVKN